MQVTDQMSTTTANANKQYEHLSDKQKALIDELARERVDDTGRIQQEIVNDAAKGNDFEAYDPTYINYARDNFEHIISERADAILNEHDSTVKSERGKVTFEGNPLDMTEQYITERPNKGGDADEEPDEEPKEPEFTPDEEREQRFWDINDPLYDAIQAIDELKLGDMDRSDANKMLDMQETLTDMRDYVHKAGNID